jgi:hypothetical protein
MRDGVFTVRAVPLRIYVEKNRNGPVDKTPPMLWDKSTNQFFALTADELEHRAPTSRRSRARQQEAVPA